MNKIKELLVASKHDEFIDSCKADILIRKAFTGYLVERGIFFTKDYNINGFTYDFRIGHYVVDINTLAKVTCLDIADKVSIDNKKYYRNKTLNALEAGFTCVHVFDWVNPDLILYGIITGNLSIVDTGRAVKHIYDTKKKTLTNEENENTVIIYDDGFDIIY